MRRDGDDPTVPRYVAAVRLRLCSACGRRMAMEGLVCTIVTLAAGSRHAQLELQFVEAGAAVLCGTGDVAV